MRKIFFLACLISTSACFGQKFSIKRVEVAGDKVNLFYDLVDTIASRTYTINMFSSRDNFITPLAKLSGDAGLEIQPGLNRKIVWNAKEELGADFDGKVGLEVRGRIYIPFVRLDGLNKTFKRNRPTEISWTGGTQQNILNIEVYKEEEKITSFTNIANVGRYTITMPKTVKPGKGYKFKITDSRNKDQIVFSQPFAVKRKVPLVVQLAPIVFVGAGVYFIVSGNKPPEEEKDIVDPFTPE